MDCYAPYRATESAGLVESQKCHVSSKVLDTTDKHSNAPGAGPGSCVMMILGLDEVASNLALREKTVNP